MLVGSFRKYLSHMKEFVFTTSSLIFSIHYADGRLDYAKGISCLEGIGHHLSQSVYVTSFP